LRRVGGGSFERVKVSDSESGSVEAADGAAEGLGGADEGELDDEGVLDEDLELDDAIKLVGGGELDARLGLDEAMPWGEMELVEPDGEASSERSWA
jgi:hypothetical protein